MATIVILAFILFFLGMISMIMSFFNKNNEFFALVFFISSFVIIAFMGIFSSFGGGAWTN